MLSEFWDGLGWLLGLDRETLNLGHMAARAFVVFVATIVMVRVGEKRFLGKNTAFDVILGIILGSVVSRAITGSSAFFPTLGAGFVLVSLHWLLAMLAFRSDRFGTLIKGNDRTLIEDGEIQWDSMRKSQISRNDLLQALRINASLTDPEQVESARLERSGDYSFITRGREPKVLEVDVRDGVQTIRLEIG